MATSNITISPQLQQTPRPDVGDLVVCRIISPKEHSYWVVKEVSMVDRVGTITHVCAVGSPHVQSKMSEFAEYKTPLDQALMKGFVHAHHVQRDHAGRIDKVLPANCAINQFFDIFECR